MLVKLKLPGVALLICAVLVTSTVTAPIVQAAPIPDLGKHIKITAREQPVDVFLKNLFALLDLPVSVDSAVTGVVNASFDARAQTILQDIKRSFGLITYYDGAVVHVSLASDVTRRIFPVAPEIAERVVYSAEDMRLTDRNNTLRTTPDGSLIVTGMGRFISLMVELVSSARRVRAAQPPLGFKAFYLRYAWAQDVTVNAAGRELFIPGVASILRSLFTPLPQHRDTRPVSQNRLLNRTRPKLRGRGLASIGKQEMLGIADDPGRSEQPGIASPDYLNQDDLTGRNGQMLQPGSPDQVRIEADPRLNAVIVRDTFERMSHYKKLIESLDVEPQSLEIEATIIDIDTNRLKELGINWRWSENDDEVSFGRDSTGPLPVPGVNATMIGGVGGVISLVDGTKDRFMARISALEVQGAAKIISRPQVLTLSNVEATFNTSSTVYVRVAGERDVDLFNISAGTTLRVTPHVFKRDGDNVSIKLLISVEDGKLERNNLESVDNIPVVKNSTINTQAIIQAGESLLIGGMVREDSSDRVSQVPLLGSIPLLGILFKSKKTVTSRIERMFLISPRLVPHDRTSVASMSIPLDDQAGNGANDRQIVTGTESGDSKSGKRLIPGSAGNNAVGSMDDNGNWQIIGIDDHQEHKAENTSDTVLDSLSDSGD